MYRVTVRNPALDFSSGTLETLEGESPVVVIHSYLDGKLIIHIFPLMFANKQPPGPSPAALSLSVIYLKAGFCYFLCGFCWCDAGFSSESDSSYRSFPTGAEQIPPAELKSHVCLTPIGLKNILKHQAKTFSTGEFRQNQNVPVSPEPWDQKLPQRLSKMIIFTGLIT